MSPQTATKAYIFIQLIKKLKTTIRTWEAVLRIVYQSIESKNSDDIKNKY